MKTAIVYYSMSGNTAMIAEKLAEKTGADLIPVRPHKTYPDKGIRKFLWGGMSAVMAETPALEPYVFKAEEYDRVILGFPVWASNMAPPMRSFARENSAALKDKEIAAFACRSGNGGEKAMKKLAELLGREEISPAVILIDPKTRPKADNDAKLKAFEDQL